MGGTKNSDFEVDSSTLMHLRRKFSAVACTLLSSNVSEDSVCLIVTRYDKTTFAQVMCLRL